MIVERDMHFTVEELNNDRYFPRYMILRRPVDNDEQEG